ncbi:MAG TPA: hypothetical protein DIU00_21525 [Phycisphaerales bacterium]|nr:hypothetical protein [Phycisphaerales bacterium]
MWKFVFIVVGVSTLLLSSMAQAAQIDATNPGDPIQGVPNDGDWPDNEHPALAIDGSSSTKYLHFKGFTQPSGFQVTPSSLQSIVTGLSLTTANDGAERDPIAFEISGSNVSIDGPYTLIASGDIVDFSQAAPWPRLTRNETPISFDNNVAYNHYQVLFTAVRDPASANSMQISEVELLRVSLTSYNPTPVDGAIIRDTWVPLGWMAGDSTASHNVYVGESFEDVQAGTGDTFRVNQTNMDYAVGFPGFPYPDGVVKGTTYYWRIEDIEADGTTIHSGPVWSFAIAPKTAYNPSPDDSAESVDPNVILSWEPGFGAILHTVFFGDDYGTVKNAVAGAPQGAATYRPGPLESGKTFYWRVDEFFGFETVTGEVWSFSTPGAVGSPNPYSGAENVKNTSILRWVAGDNAASHQVYFGTDQDAVRNATTSSPEYKDSKNLGDESYDPGLLELGAAYYWRIDEVNDLNPNSPWAGNVWAFNTADFLVVDDIESYNDIDPPNPNSNTIFGYWIDGWGTATNGALVGNDLPPYADQTTVHGGRQSMPYFYDITTKFAEAILTLDSPRDWTASDVKTLTIWFHGNLGNDPAPIYVTIANISGAPATVTHADPAATQIHGWTQWDIPLQEFADKGINLTDVNTITIGIGNKINPPGGAGTMYFDDIGLHPLVAEPEPEPEP